MRRSRIDGPEPLPWAHVLRPAPNLHDVSAVAELFVSGFRRDLATFFPQAQCELAPEAIADPGLLAPGAAIFRLLADDEGDEIELFGRRYRIRPSEHGRFRAQDHRLVAAIGAVLTLRYLHLFRLANPARLELYQGNSDDHTIAAFIEPASYGPRASCPSRIATTIQTLRTAALSTYENRRISTGVLLVGDRPEASRHLPHTPPDALTYGVELRGLKSLYRLCDGKRTLFLVDRDSKLAGIVDVARFAAEMAEGHDPDVPCARIYQPHACATRSGGHVCLVLSPNQEIKLFADGVPVFVFAHGRWRILDVAAKFAVWRSAVATAGLARLLFQAALNLAESRHGALFVVVDDPATAAGRLIAPHDLLSDAIPHGPPAALAPDDPLAKRALHYLARGRNITALDASVLEALASLDGALAIDHDGRLLAFGAILRHDALDLPGLTNAEGARTTAALVASHYGPVLKVSEDGVISCFLGGHRVWDL